MLNSQIQAYKTKQYQQRRSKHIESKLNQLRKHYNQTNNCNSQHTQSSNHVQQNRRSINRKVLNSNQYSLSDKYQLELSNTQSTDISVCGHRWAGIVQEIRRFVFEELWSATQRQTSNNSINNTTNNYYELYQQFSTLKTKLINQPKQYWQDVDKIVQQITAYIIKLEHNTQKPQLESSGNQYQYQMYEQQEIVMYQNYGCYFVYACFMLCYFGVLKDINCVKYRLVYLLGKVIQSGDQIFGQLAYAMLLDVYCKQPQLLKQSLVQYEASSEDPYSDQCYNQLHRRYVKQLVQELPSRIKNYHSQLPTLVNTLNQVQYSQPSYFSCQYELLEHLITNIHMDILHQYINTGGFEILMGVDVRFAMICLQRLVDCGSYHQLLSAIRAQYRSVLDNIYQDKQ